ncbi:MAG: hemagglutinin repeat-containing protein, partial [Alphaproteobacteria bacterium]|nr:hemagglutinin repeat-containing protein [Alphaproteobacteria bacterium]
MNMDVDGDLTVESVQNTQETSKSEHSGGMSVGISYGVNGLSPTFGANAYSGSGDGHKKWTDNVTSIIGTNSVDIDVTGKTTLTGAIIAQATPQEDGTYIDGGNLTLNTGSLEVSDLTDEDIWHYDGAGIAVGFGGPPGQPVIGSGSNLSSSYTPSLKIEDDTKIGVTHATIGAGTITIAGQAATDDQLNGVNRDVNNVQEILVDEHNSLDVEIPLDGLKDIVEVLKDIAAKLDTPNVGLSTAIEITQSLAEKLDQLGVSDADQAKLINSAGGMKAAGYIYGTELIESINGTLSSKDMALLLDGYVPVKTSDGYSWLLASDIGLTSNNGVTSILITNGAKPRTTAEIAASYQAAGLTLGGGKTLLELAGSMASDLLGSLKSIESKCGCLSAIEAAIEIGVPTIAGAVSGALAGAATGSLAGPGGAAVGALAGATSGGVAGFEVGTMGWAGEQLINASIIGDGLAYAADQAIETAANKYQAQGLSSEDAYALAAVTVIAAAYATAVSVKTVMGVVNAKGIGKIVDGEIEHSGATNKPLGLGSTGRTQPANLAEELAMKEAISNPAAGEVLPLKMNDPRWKANQGWVKMQQ